MSAFDPSRALGPINVQGAITGRVATAVSVVRSTAVPYEDAKRFRQRAADCRRIAEQTKSDEWRGSLLDLARDLEDEAASLDEEAN